MMRRNTFRWLVSVIVVLSLCLTASAAAYGSLQLHYRQLADELARTASSSTAQTSPALSPAPSPDLSPAASPSPSTTQATGSAAATTAESTAAPSLTPAVTLSPAPSITPSVTPPGAPSPTPGSAAAWAEANRLLQQQLAAALTGELTAAAHDTSRLENRATYGIQPVQKFVYRTFDDGPSSYTPLVLQILKRNQIKATFFVEYFPEPAYFRQIAADGHTLALHCYAHDYAQLYASDAAYFADLKRISDYVWDITGIDSRIVRLPGGSSNTISRNYSPGIMTRIVASLSRQGYVYFDWNAQAMDATTPGITPDAILRNVESFTMLNGSAKPFIILLLHNGKDEPTTPDALQSIIDYYRRLGYAFAPITEMTPTIHQPVQN